MNRKSYAAVRIVIYSLVTLILCAVLAWGTAFNTLNLGGISFGTSSFTYDDTGFHTADQPITFSADEVSSLDIEWVAGSVEISRGKGDEILVSESADDSLDDEDLLRYRLKNGRLEIKYCKSHISIGLFNSDPVKHLSVTLPEKLYDQIAIDAVSADVGISSLEAASLQLVSVSGSTTLTDVSLLKNLDYEGVSGNFTAANTDCTEFHAENVSGVVELNGSIERSADMETVSGDIRITSAICPKEVDGESVSASFFITLPANSNFACELESASGKLQSDFGRNSGGPEFSFETVSGNVYLNKQ